jgi:hypothetical protein
LFFRLGTKLWSALLLVVVVFRASRLRSVLFGGFAAAGGGNLAEIWCSFNFISWGLKGFLLQDADLCEDPDGQDDYS